MSNLSDSEDELTLSANTLAALQEFQQEQQQHERKFRSMYDQADDEFSAKKKKEGINLFKEDWQLSQFWYSDNTADILADALLEGANSETVIAIASAPSVYAAIQKRPDTEIPTKHIFLLEFDKRFELLAGKEHFIYYDFNHPLEFDDKIKAKVDRLIIDPPFLNEECQTKSSITARALLSSTEDSRINQRLISCTGERMAGIIATVYPETKITTFLPEHANGLSNEFRCYANFECSKWSFDQAYN